MTGSNKYCQKWQLTGTIRCGSKGMQIHLTPLENRQILVKAFPQHLPFPSSHSTPRYLHKRNDNSKFSTQRQPHKYTLTTLPITAKSCKQSKCLSICKKPKMSYNGIVLSNNRNKNRFTQRGLISNAQILKENRQKKKPVPTV